MNTRPSDRPGERAATSAHPRAKKNPVCHERLPGERPAKRVGQSSVHYDWFTLHLAEGAEELIEEVWNMAAATGTQFEPTQAVFSKIRPGIGLAVYFTPAAQVLARMFGAIHCRQPRPDSLELLLGEQNAWDVHFPQFAGTRRLPPSARLRAAAGPAPSVSQLANDQVAPDDPSGQAEREPEHA